MIDFLILYELNKSVLTMYGISREILSEFSVLTTPSYGTIKPALAKLERLGCVKSQKTMSLGGRPSTYYSITDKGKARLKELLLEQPQDNPIQFLPFARIRLACADLLTNSEQKKLFSILKLKSTTIFADIKRNLENEEIEFYPKMIFDNLSCEYKNFISLLEGFERASKN